MIAHYDARDCVLFFGVGHGDSAGHYFLAPNAFGRDRVQQYLPKRFQNPDGTLQPGCKIDPASVQYGGERWVSTTPQVEGHCLVHFSEGWTALSTWDRSADKRSGCNANFFVRVRLSFAQMVERARAEWPDLFKRFGFELRLVGPDIDPVGECWNCDEPARWMIVDAVATPRSSCGTHLVMGLSREHAATVHPVT